MPTRTPKSQKIKVPRAPRERGKVGILKNKKRGK